MRNLASYAGIFMLPAAPTPAAALAAKAAPLAGLHYLVGTWNCTHRAGAVRLPYDVTYTYDGDGHRLRQIVPLEGGSDEELIAYDAQRSTWTVVLDDKGTATIMRATGSDPNHIVLPQRLSRRQHRRYVRSRLGDDVYAARDGALSWYSDHLHRYLLPRSALGVRAQAVA